MAGTKVFRTGFVITVLLGAVGWQLGSGSGSGSRGCLQLQPQTTNKRANKIPNFFLPSWHFHDLPLGAWAPWTPIRLLPPAVGSIPFWHGPTTRLRLPLS